MNRKQRQNESNPPAFLMPPTLHPLPHRAKPEGRDEVRGNTPISEQRSSNTSTPSELGGGELFRGRNPGPRKRGKNSTQEKARSDYTEIPRLSKHDYQLTTVESK